VLAKASRERDSTFNVAKMTEGSCNSSVAPLESGATNASPPF
jgi:hypothetical protein